MVPEPISVGMTVGSRSTLRVRGGEIPPFTPMKVVAVSEGKATLRLKDGSLCRLATDQLLPMHEATPVNDPSEPAPASPIRQGSVTERPSVGESEAASVLVGLIGLIPGWYLGVALGEWASAALLSLDLPGTLDRDAANLLDLGLKLAGLFGGFAAFAGLGQVAMDAYRKRYPAEDQAPMPLPDIAVWFVLVPALWITAAVSSPWAYENPLFALFILWGITAGVSWGAGRTYTGWANTWRRVAASLGVLAVLALAGLSSSSSP